MNKHICIIGAFGFGVEPNGGQMIKTHELYSALCDKYGKSMIECVDTYNWKCRPLKLLFDLNRKVSKSDMLIMLPAHNGVEVFSRLLVRYKKRKNKKIYYDVIGGWLPDKLDEHPSLIRYLKNFDGIWVETSNMKQLLEQKNMNMVSIIPNFKKLSVIKEEELVFTKEKPFKFCTFSRVTEEKGITDAIKAVTMVNSRLGEGVCYLDIYGQIDAEYEERFFDIIKKSPSCIKYKGLVDSNQSVSVLMKYYGLLFPTYYSGEGMAGTLVDAMSSGIPSIVSDWRYNSEIIENGITGLICKTKNPDDLAEKIIWAISNITQWNEMKYNCLKESEKYKPNNVLDQIVKMIE